MLIAVDTWLSAVHSRAMCLMQTDVAAALHDAARIAGRSPAMNASAAELALRFEGVHFVPQHLDSTLNFQCRALSRLAEGAEVPANFKHVARAAPRKREPCFF